MSIEGLGGFLLLRNVRTSDMQVKEWCRQNNIDQRKFYYWQRKLRGAALNTLPETSAQSLVVELTLSEQELYQKLESLGIAYQMKCINVLLFSQLPLKCKNIMWLYTVAMQIVAIFKFEKEFSKLSPEERLNECQLTIQPLARPSLHRLNLKRMIAYHNLKQEKVLPIVPIKKNTLKFS